MMKLFYILTMVVVIQHRTVMPKKDQKKGAWVAQSVKHPTLDFGSGHDLRIMRSSLPSGSVLSAESV